MEMCASHDFDGNVETAEWEAATVVTIKAAQVCQHACQITFWQADQKAFTKALPLNTLWWQTPLAESTRLERCASSDITVII